MKSDFEESTKIHSAAELDEMVRRAKSEPAPEFDDDEHTMIGNSQELAARSMSVPDAAPPPRASNNIIRRTGPVMAVRPASEPPAPEPDVVELDPDEDDAFAPWDDAAQRTSPQSPDQLVAALKETVPAERTTPEVPARTAPPVVEARSEGPNLELMRPAEPRLAAPMVTTPSLVESARPTKLRVGRIIAVVAVALLIGVVALGYRRIRALEDELAETKAALDAATRSSR